MATEEHNIELTTLSRPQLKHLQNDLTRELAAREDDDRIALEDKLRELVEQAGFDPSALHIGIAKKLGRPKGSRKNGKADAVEA